CELVRCVNVRKFTVEGMDRSVVRVDVVDAPLAAIAEIKLVDNALVLGRSPPLRHVLAGGGCFPHQVAWEVELAAHADDGFAGRDFDVELVLRGHSRSLSIGNAGLMRITHC